MYALCNNWLTRDVQFRLTADALHALTDLVSDIMTLATISYSLKPATSRFPTGYGKIESLGALAVSGLLLSGGIMIGLQALMALSQQFFPEIAHILSHFEIFGHGHSHSHGTEHFGPNINAAWLAGGSIIIKEWLYRATMKIANQKRSSVLASNAYHHRVDSLTAFVALLTISASHFLTSAAWLDPVGGLAISGMIVQAGWGNTKSAMLELADVAMDEEVKESVEKAAGNALQAQSSGEAEIRGVQGIKSGQNFLVDIEVGAPSHYTVGQLDDIKTAMIEKIGSDVKGIRRVTVRFTAAKEVGLPFADEFIAGKEENLEDDGHDHAHEHVHDHGHSHDEGHSSSTQLNGNANKRK